MIWEDRREMIQALWNHVKRGLEFTCWQSGLGKKEITQSERWSQMLQVVSSYLFLA